MGAGPCSPRPNLHLLLLLLLLVHLVYILPIASPSAADSDALLAFKSSLSGGDAILSDWDDHHPPCVGDTPKWSGVLCNSGAVLGLQLEGLSLSGTLSLDVLSGIPGLRTLSFMNNSFSGPLPDVKKLPYLKSLYLSFNKFSGHIPGEAFSGMGSLKKVYLSSNQFSGAIPASFASLPRLLELMLDGNGFTGGIPDLHQKELKLVNVANNQLEGPIPASLSKMDAALFAGNKGLCGAPLPVVCDALPTSKKPSVPVAAAAAAVGVGVILAFIGGIFAVMRRRREEDLQLGRPQSKSQQQHRKTGSYGDGSIPPMPGRHAKRRSGQSEEMLEQGPDDCSNIKKAAASKPHEQGKLVFVNALRGDREKFELQDLLKASAEILAGGSLGSCYKATLTNGGPSVVVKRFKEMNAVGREEFQEHMNRLGRLSHPNLLPLVAYYYRREEKLLVTEFATAGNLASLLHETNKGGLLDWPARLRILKGVARGMSYLYESLRMLGLPHGHLKSSNVVVDGESREAMLTDYGLGPVTNQAHAAQVMTAYRAPEVRQFGRTTKKSDVWCLGLLILEVLTGKQGGSSGEDLAGWVESEVREEWTGEVFDGGMKGTKGAEGEMLKLLRIGLACCEGDVDKRWEMGEAVDRIEELSERDAGCSDGGGGEDDFYSSYAASEGEAHSSRAASQDLSSSMKG